jgi:DNA-binding protein HU-beta
VAVATKARTKAEVVEYLATKGEVSKRQAEDILNYFMDYVKDSLKKGITVRLIPFGTWEVKTRKARTGRNPQTNEVIKIKAKKVPRFKPGMGLKNAIK